MLIFEAALPLLINFLVFYDLAKNLVIIEILLSVRGKVLGGSDVL